MTKTPKGFPCLKRNALRALGLKGKVEARGRRKKKRNFFLPSPNHNPFQTHSPLPSSFNPPQHGESKRKEERRRSSSSFSAEARAHLPSLPSFQPARNPPTGILVPIITIFNDDESINYEAHKKHSESKLSGRTCPTETRGLKLLLLLFSQFSSWPGLEFTDSSLLDRPLRLLL